MKSLKRKFASSLALWVLLSATHLASAFYDPSLGRWVNRDPIKELGHFALRYRHSVQIGIKEKNSYTFVKNSPIDRVDTLGLDDRGWPLNGVVCNTCVKPQDYGTEVYVLLRIA